MFAGCGAQPNLCIEVWGIDDEDLPDTLTLTSFDHADQTCQDDPDGRFVDDLPLVDGSAEAHLPAGVYEVWAAGDDWQGCIGVDVPELRLGARCEPVSMELGQRDDDPWVDSDAPNLYLYPTTPSTLSVRLPRPERLKATDPPYLGHGWEVAAWPDGRLSTQAGPRDFLFYEVRVALADFQRSAGWCSARSQALADMETAMATVGFLDREIADFAEFWDRELPAAPWLTVYPQRDPAPPDIEPRPDHLLQLWFLVERGCAPVDAPDLAPTPRRAYHAADWGVVLGPGLASPEHEGLALGLAH